jgi:hypothetical protein
LPEFPKPNHLEDATWYQGVDNGPKYIRADVPAPNEANRYSADFIPAYKWTDDYRPYVKPGEPIKNWRTIEFAPGAISRGIGRASTSAPMQAIYDRNFNWPKYKQMIEAGKAPSTAAYNALPDYVLDWDNIVYEPSRGYGPKHVVVNNLNEGAISRGTPRGRIADIVTGEYLVNPNTQGAIHQYHQLTPEAIKSLKNYTAYDDIVKDKDHPTWQELTRVLMRINAGTSTSY